MTNLQTETEDTTTTQTFNWDASAPAPETSTCKIIDNSLNPDVAKLTFKHSKIAITLYKKLNWFQVLCYNILGFEYEIL
jgi:hypothetical protein